MSYIGSTPTTQSFIAGTDYFNGNGSTVAFTLSRSVVSVNDIEAVVNNVVQQPNSAYTISGTTITFTSAPSAGTSNIYVRYLSTTTQSITPSQNTVSYSTLNSDNQSKLGISFKNRIINGAMTISQYNGTSSVTLGIGNPTYTLDRWGFQTSQASKLSVQQNAGSVTPPAGFSNYLGATSLSAYSVGSSDYYTFQQRVEGYNVADLSWGTANAKTVTLSFWVYSSLTGTFGGALGNGAFTRSYPFSYTISSANTWQQISVTIPGDASGTWLTTNGIGMFVTFGLGVGATYSGTAGSWQSAGLLTCTGATSVVGTNGATFYTTGIQLEVGTQATTFDYRSIGTELQLCQRYYAKMGTAGTLYCAFGSCGWTSTTGVNGFIKYPTTMRSSPTLSYGGVIAATYAGGATSNVTGVGSTYTGTDSAMWQPSGLSGGVNGQGGVIISFNDSTAFVSLSAEL